MGFEPTELAFSGFQDRPVRPLRHPSISTLVLDDILRVPQFPRVPRGRRQMVTDHEMSTGSIRREHDGWEIRVSAGTDHRTVKRRRLSRFVSRRREARRDG